MMATIPVNGTELYYEEQGRGPAVLFIHGMCGSAATWHDQQRRLAPHFRCVAYDRRGHTRSPLGDVAQRTVELHADDAATLIQALDLAPCLVVGSSGGARIALDVARRYPALLSGAVLSEPPVFALDPAGAADFVGPLKPRIEQAVATGGPRAAVDAFFEMVCPGIWNVLDDTRRDAFRDNAAELFGDLQMPPYAITPADLRAFTVPCRIIRGDKSHPAFGRVTQVLAAHIPGADLVALPASGHVTYFEQPDAFAQAVITFADRRPGAQHTLIGQQAGV
jgi:pimeloyl-ACP methyl ester carboxylesterase